MEWGRQGPEVFRLYNANHFLKGSRLAYKTLSVKAKLAVDPWNASKLQSHMLSSKTLKSQMFSRPSVVQFKGCYFPSCL